VTVSDTKNQTPRAALAPALDPAETVCRECWSRATRASVGLVADRPHPPSRA